ncbi:hypothetical protein FRX31_020618 [Thalictrum thalictroides]|uniref:Anther-specific protein BCP1-like n=1 Tax=Thalictrum thalictroides TaxID=46969 RepID=A0A7J6W0D4_THATH|nr:hypothetical protein FRX31_020618 [Thalictrum thalictroides]
MARQIVVLALVFFAIVGAVSAKNHQEAKAPSAQAPVASAEGPSGIAEEAASSPTVGEGGEVIGETDNDAPSGPLGPVTAEGLGPSSDGKSGAGALKVSIAVVGVAAVAGFLSF